MIGKLVKGWNTDGEYKTDTFGPYHGTKESMDDYTLWWKTIGENEAALFDGLVQQWEDPEESASQPELDFNRIVKNYEDQREVQEAIAKVRDANTIEEVLENDVDVLDNTNGKGKRVKVSTDTNPPIN